MKTSFRLLSTITLSILLASCKMDVEWGNSIKGDGNVVTESRNNDTPFTGIEVGRGLDLEIEQSTEKSITVIADKNLQNHISTDINDGILSISCDANIRNAESKKVIVKLPVITSIQVTSGATAKGLGLIKNNNLDLVTSSAGEMKLQIEAENVSIQASSGSTVKVKGKALKVETQSSSGSNIEAQELMANNIISEASSGSSTDVYPIENLKADASSGASINYHHTPKSIDKSASSGGSVGGE
ncbi:MAG: head GIN domain-containing protein [Flavobacteriaceae bacterium]